MAKGPPVKKANKPAVVKNRVTTNGVFFDYVHTWGARFFLLLSSVLFLQTRLRLLAIPLERDEGSFAYIGHWLFKGRQLYTDMLDSKLPGLYMVYAFFTSLFGYNATGVHMGLLIANIASAVCFYILLKELYNSFVASLATSFFLWMVLSINMVGFATHATQLLTPFVLGSFVLFWKGIHSRRVALFFISGLLMGIAFTIKQQSAIYGMLLASLWWPARIWWYKKEESTLPFKEWILLGLGGFIPLVLIVGYFVIVGRLDQFYTWTVVQPFHLAGAYTQSWYSMFFGTMKGVLYKFEGIWILAAIGLPLIFLSGFKKEKPWFGMFVAVLGMLSVAIGAAYYLHYFVLAIPGVALLAAITLNWLSQKTGKYGPLLSITIATLLLALSMKGRAYYYFQSDYAKIHFQLYNQNMFPELEKIGEELAKRVPEGQRIAILGSEPEVLVAADRESCSRHLMVYSLLIDPVLSPPLQAEYIREIKECAPEYIVWNTGSGSWTAGYENLVFFKELIEWVKQNYQGIGLAESRDDKPGIIVWDEAARKYIPQNGYKIYVLKKMEIPRTEPASVQ